MKTVYLVHGFNVRDQGRATVRLLVRQLVKAGLRVVLITYGWMGRIHVRLCNPHLSDLLADVVEPGSIGIGHSNGCAILDNAADRGAEFEQLIYVDPALDKDKAPASHVKRLDVFHDPTDIWPRIAAWIPFSPWGSMGSTGYVGSDKRVINHAHSFGHSGLFKHDPEAVLKVVL